MPRKKSRHASERERPQVTLARAAYQDNIAALPKERFQFIDESSVNIAMPRLCGRARRGQWVVDAVRKHHGRNVMLLGSLSCHALDAALKRALDTITAADACGGSAHCGYALQ